MGTRAGTLLQSREGVEIGLPHSSITIPILKSQQHRPSSFQYSLPGRSRSVCHFPIESAWHSLSNPVNCCGRLTACAALGVIALSRGTCSYEICICEGSRRRGPYCRGERGSARSCLRQVPHLLPVLCMARSMGTRRVQPECVCTSGSLYNLQAELSPRAGLGVEQGLVGAGGFATRKVPHGLGDITLDVRALVRVRRGTGRGTQAGTLRARRRGPTRSRSSALLIWAPSFC
jgi:hypothetical protein